MPELTTIDGTTITFNSDAVAVVTDHDERGQPVTCVYGITKAELQMRESVPDFLGRLGISQAFAKLTRPNGTPVWINGKAVSSIRSPLLDEYAQEVMSVITTAALTQGVEETPDEVKAQIDAHGGKL